MARNKKSEVPHYEMLYIVSNKYTEKEVETIQEEVKKIIEKHDGKITYSENWGKKKLMYPINHFNHGYYALYEFDALAANMQKINDEVRLDNKILRFMVVSKKARTKSEIQEEKMRAQEILKQEVKETEKEKEAEEKKEEAPKKEDKKVDLKELDDKLDKILDTDDLL